MYTFLCLHMYKHIFAKTFKKLVMKIDSREAIGGIFTFYCIVFSVSFFFYTMHILNSKKSSMTKNAFFKKVL